MKSIKKGNIVKFYGSYQKKIQISCIFANSSNVDHPIIQSGSSKIRNLFILVK